MNQSQLVPVNFIVTLIFSDYYLTLKEE